MLRNKKCIEKYKSMSNFDQSIDRKSNLPISVSAPTSPRTGIYCKTINEINSRISQRKKEEEIRLLNEPPEEESSDDEYQSAYYDF